MKVSVVIVNWNGLATLSECLAGLAAQTAAPHQVLVVDNGSQDGSVEFLANQTIIPLKIIALKKNFGFAGGNNAALPYITGEVVALLNNDAIPQPTWISSVLEHFNRPHIGMVACQIVRISNPAVMDKAGHLIYPDGLNRGLGTGAAAALFQEPREVLWPDGCAAFYAKSLLDKIGFFDEDFFLYGEDADLGFRARWAGAGCLYEPKSLVYHHHSASLGKFSPQKAYYIERNRIWVLIKNFPLSWILISPIFTLMRYCMNGVSMLSGKGSAAGFEKAHGKGPLLKALFMALWHGSLGIPKMIKKRRQMVRSISGKAMKRLLRQHMIRLKEITLVD